MNADAWKSILACCHVTYNRGSTAAHPVRYPVSAMRRRSPAATQRADMNADTA